MNKKLELKQVTINQMLGLIFLAYAFSFAIRLIWVYQFQDNPSFHWNGQLMINTNDGYFFASGAQEALSGMHADNPRVFGIWDYGVIFFTTLFSKITPFSLETITLYMPAFISSLVVIPIILIARLYGQALWGFLAALLGSITWSYYNRTMTGYYDTDMFSAMAPMLILFFLMKSAIDFNLRSALYAAIAIVLYPFLYDQGQSIVYAMGIIYGAYMVFYHKNESIAYASLILIFLSLVPLGGLGIGKPMTYLASLLLVGIAYAILEKGDYAQKQLMITSAVIFVSFLLLGNVFGLILGKILSYTITGTQESGLHFYAVNQTVREAGETLFFPLPDNLPYKANIAHRMVGSSFGLIAALMGYIFLLIHKKEFILALPLIGIGIFAHWGGLRFTVYAVPVAAMSAVYLFLAIGDFFKNSIAKYTFVFLATAVMVYPNIAHIVKYRVPTVLNKVEVQDLVNLNKIADAKDYTLTWWDYGYPVWYYSDTSTLIDGGKHDNDNFIISKIMQTPSPELAANLSRLAVETYVDSNYSIVANTLFKNGEKEQKDPNLFLSELENGAAPLPKKTRDVYLYMPYRMLDIFPTVIVFGNLDLRTGKKLREAHFYPTSAVSKKGTLITFSNGIVFDMQKGEILIQGKREKVRSFFVTENEKGRKPRVRSQFYHVDGEYVVVYMKSYGRFVVMDKETFRSLYVQMFMLGRYDKNLFELVVSSPYSKIYKLKR